MQGWPGLFILILIFPENLNLYLQSELPRTIKQMQNMDVGWQGFILRSGIEKNEIIHSLIKHSLKEKKEWNILKKRKLLFFWQKIFHSNKKIVVIQLFLLCSKLTSKYISFGFCWNCLRPQFEVDFKILCKYQDICTEMKIADIVWKYKFSF